MIFGRNRVSGMGPITAAKMSPYIHTHTSVVGAVCFGIPCELQLDSRLSRRDRKTFRDYIIILLCRGPRLHRLSRLVFGRAIVENGQFEKNVMDAPRR